MSRLPTRSRSLKVEALEPRAMLAGNVTVVVTDGILRIHGDNASNSIEIQQLEQTCEGQWRYKIIGHATEIQQPKYRTTGHAPIDPIGPSVPTTINGSSTSVVVEGVKFGVNIFLRSGDNRLKIGHAIYPDDLPARPVSLFDTRPAPQPVNLPGRVQIGTWKGNDDIRLSVHNEMSVTLTTGPGYDQLLITRSSFEDELRVNFGEGGSYCQFTHDVALNGPTDIQCGSGPDFLDLPNDVHGDFHADLAGGNDRFSIFGTSTTVLQIDLGSGDDGGRVRTEWLAGISMDGGEGKDFVGLDSARGSDDTFTNFESFI